MKLIYKIRAADGTYAKGGHVSFNAKGKYWNGAGPLSNHLGSLHPSGLERYRQAGAKVVVLQVIEEPVEEYTIDEWLLGVAERREKREKGWKSRRARLDAERLQARIKDMENELTKLKKEAHNG